MIRRLLSRLAPGSATDGEANAHLAQLLSTYAARRLSPSPRQLRQIRSSVLQAYAEQPAWRAVPGGRRRSVSRRWAPVMAMVALLLVGGTVAAAEQSGPGEPFYNVRLTIESLTLPRQGPARVDALLRQLETRLDEAHAAGMRDHASGVTDAVGAYRDTLAKLTAEVGPDERQAFIAERLEHHVDVLRAVLGDAPAPARAGLQQALDQAQRALEGIQRAPLPPPVPADRPGSSPPIDRPGPPQTLPGRP